MATVKAPGAAGAFPLRTVVFGALVPALLFGIAIGLALPIIPASATRLGADLAGAGFVAALLPIGKVLADLPAGAIASRIGDDQAMILAAVLGVAAFAGAALAPSLVVLAISVLALGASTAVFHLARHAHLTAVTPVTHRARVLSTLGGVHRIGYLVGPFAGAVLILGSSITSAYWVASGCSALALIVLLLAREPRARRPRHSTAQRASIWSVAREHRRLLRSLGTACLLVGAVRGARQTVLPLWGEHLGLEPATVSLIFGLSGALDILLFYPAGVAMDRLGRLWVAIPSMVTMGVAMTFLPMTTGTVSMALVAGLLGLGNGLGSGILMTLGADVAPAETRSAFLGVWRLFQDTGEGIGPLVITAGAAAGSLAAGIWVAAAFSGLSSWALGRWVPTYSVHANARTRREAGLLRHAPQTDSST